MTECARVTALFKFLSYVQEEALSSSLPELIFVTICITERGLLLVYVQRTLY